MTAERNRFVRWLDSAAKSEEANLGGKGKNIARLLNYGIPCPAGFCITTEAFKYYLETSGIEARIIEILQDPSPGSSANASNQIRELLRDTHVPEEIADTIILAYHQMRSGSTKDLAVAVRSSATVEDAMANSFAGQFDSFLGIVGEQSLIQSIMQCWLSLFNARSIAYARRFHHGAIPLEMAVVVQQLVHATAAGVMFTVHPVKLDPEYIVIEATYGLG